MTIAPLNPATVAATPPSMGPSIPDMLMVLASMPVAVAFSSFLSITYLREPTYMHAHELASNT